MLEHQDRVVVADRRAEQPIQVLDGAGTTILRPGMFRNQFSADWECCGAEPGAGAVGHPDRDRHAAWPPVV